MDDRPHILFLIDHLWAVAGAEGALLRTARLLPQSRYRCSIGAFCVNPDLAVLKTFPWPVTEFRFDGKLNAQSIRTALQFRRFIRSQRVDIVHTFLESANIWGGLFACLSGCPVLISTRRDLGILRSGKHRLAYRLLNPLVDQVQAVSRAARDHTIRSEKLTPNKVVVIPNGIDMPQPGTDANRRDLVKSLGLKENCRVVISVANIRRVKGIDVLIRAAQQVCREYPETVFLVAGAVNEPDYYSELKALTAQLKLSDNVRFLGQRSDVQSLLHLSEIFCLLSRSEGMSNALLEAMSCCLPCIVTAVGGNSEVISDGREGYLVRSEDADRAAARIIALLRDRELAKSLGRSAQRTVEEQFTAETMVRRVTDMYDQLLKRKMLAYTQAECESI